MFNHGDGTAFSSPGPETPAPFLTSHGHSHELPTIPDITFEGIAANVKLLLKLIHEQSQASNGPEPDDRKTQRIASMLTIIDDVKIRIQNYSPSVATIKEFRRCNTDHRPPRDHKMSADDGKDKLRELHACNTSKKSLEAMCCSLGKEKKIMAFELSRKVQELNGMEELINDFKAQNQILLAKVQACAAEHGNKNKSGGETELETNVATLQARNKALSEQVLKSLNGYKSLNRKYKDVKEENLGFQTTMEKIQEEVAAGLVRINGLKQQLAAENDIKQSDSIEKEISELESLFHSFNIKISKHMQKKIKCKLKLRSMFRSPIGDRTLLQTYNIVHSHYLLFAV